MYQSGSPPRRFPPPQRCCTASAASLLALLGVAVEAFPLDVLALIRVPPQLVAVEVLRLDCENSARKRRGVDKGFGRRRCVGACMGRYVERNHLENPRQR